jgi:hypothetical protein
LFIKLGEYDYTIEHKSGFEIAHADTFGDFKTNINTWSKLRTIDSLDVASHDEEAGPLPTVESRPLRKRRLLLALLSFTPPPLQVLLQVREPKPEQVIQNESNL